MGLCDSPVIDRQRGSAESSNDSSPVFFPNPAGNLELEFHLVYLALRVGVGNDSSSFKLLSGSGRKRGRG